MVVLYDDSHRHVHCESGCFSHRYILNTFTNGTMQDPLYSDAYSDPSLSVTRMKVGIEKVEDLLNQKALKWGTVAGTSPITLMEVQH